MADAKNNGYFWNSDNADRVYDADSFSNWLKKFFTTGVFSGDLMVTPAGGMSLSVSPGYCNIEGKVRIFEGTSNLTLDPASANYPRIDSVVITCDYTKRSIDIGVLKGSYSGSNPAPADLTRNMSMYQIALAQVKVGAGTTTITEADITDTRADSTLCGLVTGTVHEINIDGVTKQYAQIFSDWFQSIKDKLSGDTAGNLQKQIDELTGKINADTNAIDQIIKNTAQIETAGSATSAHSAGEYVMISNALYKVTASVAKGDTWTIGTNVTAANVGNEIASLKSNLAKTMYPVGSIYISVNATNPAALFGGTWEQIKGRFLLGTGSNDANTTDWWGSEWAGHYNVPAGELGGESMHTLTVDQMPSHTHQAYADNNYSGNRVGDTNPWKQSLVNRDLHLLSDGYYFGFTGGNQPHNNMPPYLGVYMWKRTA